jgi:hypothetical protein
MGILRVVGGGRWPLLICAAAAPLPACQLRVGHLPVLHMVFCLFVDVLVNE